MNKKKILLLFSLGAVLVYFSCRKERTSDNLRGENKPPVAIAGNDTVIILPQDSFVLKGTKSYDPDGTIGQMLWSKISGPSKYLLTQLQTGDAVLKNFTKGIYQFELKVSDDEGLAAKDTVMVTVDSLGANTHPPVARAGQDLEILLPTDAAILDGSSSYDADNDIVSYSWTKISGPSSFHIADANAVQTQASSLIAGIYQFELKVTDANNLTGKDSVNVIVKSPDITVECEQGRPVVNARLRQVGTLSEAKMALVSASAGGKILFAGGWTAGAYSSRVDIYDINTNTWSTAELTQPERQGMVAASVGSKILFAGGGDNDNGATTSRVDIYDVSNNTWSTAELSQGREYLAAATLGDKVYFAGGNSWSTNSMGYSTWVKSNVVDIYDNASNTWTTASLSQSRSELTAATAGNKIYFAGGFAGPFVENISTVIDVFDGESNSWSTSHLEQPKASHASIASGNKVFWAGGFFNYAANNFYPSNSVEIRDLNTGVSTHVCIIPKIMSTAVMKANDIIFFPGNSYNGQYSGSEFDIYHSATGKWSTGHIDREIYNATIISVNNTIYIAGGTDKSWGPYLKEVWTLEY